MTVAAGPSVVRRAAHLRGTLELPGDKSIAHRALIVGALSGGPASVSVRAPGADVRSTAAGLRALGVAIEELANEERIQFTVRGRPSRNATIDCGNSGTTMRLLAGMLVGQPFTSRLVGDGSLSKRPMGRIIEPLRLMGAKIEAEGENETAPLRIEGAPLHGIKYSLPVASAQLKSALLFAGLFAKGKTIVQESVPTRNHTELMLNYFLVRAHKDEGGVSVFGDQVPESRDFSIPGDISSAAFWLVAAAAQPGGHVLVRDVGLNETRTGLLGVLVRMGAQVREAIEDVEQVEPRGILEITGAPLKATVIQGKEVPQLIDELPILAVAGALANGTTIIRQAQELRAKETDRIAAIAHNLRSMGAQVVELRDGLEIHGRAPLHGARLSSFGDHRIAMAFAVAGMFAEGETVIQDVDCVATSYPGFEKTLNELVNPKTFRTTTPVISLPSHSRPEVD